MFNAGGAIVGLKHEVKCGAQQSEVEDGYKGECSDIGRERVENNSNELVGKTYPPLHCARIVERPATSASAGTVLGTFLLFRGGYRQGPVKWNSELINTPPAFGTTITSSKALQNLGRNI
ncbi:hypothetical protein Tsubulata_034845 [Turnera subulata]|uniref:Uncharacterized protein n=1 Tax=Turnera subulata TaxID=218843 RepID=A0A9Q0G9G4_9ROSI|nr:hypothetical protein Tsubulata_034845 [Turnera subulata]